MTLEGAEFESILRNLKIPMEQLADAQKQLAEMTVRNEYQTKSVEQEMTIKHLTDEIKNLKGEITRKDENIKKLEKQLDAMMVQNTAMALKQMWQLGRFIMSTEKMREQFNKCLMANDGHTAYIMMNFAENASYYDLDDEGRRFFESLMPKSAAGITFNAPVNNNGGTLTGNITTLKKDGNE